MRLKELQEAKSAYDAGASIIHLHRWDDGTPYSGLRQISGSNRCYIKVCPDVIIQLYGRSCRHVRYGRLASLDVVPKPEFATLDCGTLNFGGDEIFVNTDNTMAQFC